MAKKDRKLSASESAFIEEQTKTLAADLAFYARGPVRIKLIGGNHIAYTYGCEDKLHTINVVMNPSILLKVRNRTRAVAIWRGIGFHELAHHLYPAEQQYKQAIKEGFKSLFNLVDDEQNERRARAANPSWGACFQSVCAYIFPSKKLKPAGKLSTGIEDSEEDEKEPEGMEAQEIYSKRWSEFAYHFRRHLPGAEDPLVIETLSLVPKRFKDLSKPELLDLTRQMHEVLSRGIDLPEAARPAQQKSEPVPVEPEPQTPEPEKEAEPVEDPILPPLPPLEGPGFFKNLFTSKWSHVALAVFVLGWSVVLFGQGMPYWLTVAKWVGVLTAVIAAVIVVRKIARSISRKLAARAAMKAVGTLRKPPAGIRVKIGGWADRLRERVCEFGDWLNEKITLLMLSRKMRWLKSHILDTAQWLWASVSRVLQRCWRNTMLRIALLAAPIAAGLAMLTAVLTEAASYSKWLLLLTIIWLLLMAILGWIFRKKIKDFLLAELYTDTEFPFEPDFDMPLDKTTLTFNVVSNVVPVDADSDFLQAVLPEIHPIAQQLRGDIEKCGSVIVDKDYQDQGYDLIDELEQVYMGETSVFVDEALKTKASLHIEIGLDCSGSMASPTKTLKAGEKFRLGKMFALAVEESIRNLPGVSSHFWGYTDGAIFDCGEAGQSRMSGLSIQGGNNDSAMMWHMMQSAARSGKELKILLMISDGQPSDCSWGSLHYLVNQAEAGGMIPVQIAVDTIKDPAFQRFFVDLVGQTMAEAVMTMGYTLVSIVESES